LSSYVQAFNQFNYSILLVLSDRDDYKILDVKLNSRHSSISPRGPPALG
jgi:hypothetical protein